MSVMADIFKDIHGAIDLDSLVPLKQFVGTSPDFLTKREFEETVAYLEIDENHIFYDQDSFLNKLVYWNEFNYLPLHGISSVETMKSMKMMERIHDLDKHFCKLKTEKDYDSIFMYMDKKLIIPMYKKCFDEIPIEQRYEIFVDLHIRSEYGFEMFDDEFLKKVFALRKNSIEHKQRMETLHEKINNPQKFLVYHGHNADHDPKDEYSWTLKKDTAYFFANRFKKMGEHSGKITKKYIKFDDVIDFFDSRGEDEIILWTNKLKS